jgi:hypothetical protein
LELDEEEEVEVELDEELEKELMELDEVEEVVEAEPVVEVEEEEASVKPTVAQPLGHNGLLDTGEGFSLRLPKDAVDNIIASLDSTPHDGYVPVVAFGPSGQIMLTFESADKSA